MEDTLGEYFKSTCTANCSTFTCAANRDCNNVTCGDPREIIKLAILMCEKIPQVELLASAEFAQTTVFIFDNSPNSTTKGIPGGKLSATLNWNKHTEILGVEVSPSSIMVIITFGSYFHCHTCLVSRSRYVVPVSAVLCMTHFVITLAIYSFHPNLWLV